MVENRQRSLVAIIVCIAVYGITVGLTQPLLSLILEARGVDRTLIGLNAAMPAFATLAFSPAIPALLKRFGIRPFLYGCIVGDLSLFMSLKLFDQLYLWFIIRFLMGATIAGLFVASETWINESAAEHNRGRVVGLYAAAMSASFALGPTIIPITGIDGWTPFVAGALFIGLAAVPLWFTGNQVPSLKGETSFSVLSFLFVAPTLGLAVLLVGFMESTVMALLPVYGVRSGLAAGSAALMLTAVGIGGVALQWPIGWLADHANRYLVLVLCAAGGGVGALLLPLLIGRGEIFWAMLFVWGGIFAGVYTVALALLGERFRGAELVTANAAFGLLWGLGGLAGPSLAGIGMDILDPDGLPVVLFLASGGFILLAVCRRHGARH
jgi:MFS family permease